MTDVTQNEAVESEDSVAVDELSILKQRAKLMGLKVSNNISLEALKEKIAAKTAENDVPVVEENPIIKLRREQIAEQTKLIRIRVTCMDAKKADLPGEIFTIANEYIGTIKKFVPFGSATDNGYHVPFCIYNFMKERQFLQIRTVKDPKTGVERVDHRFVPEFSLEVLPPLTKEELAKLAASQAAAGGVD